MVSRVRYAGMIVLVKGMNEVCIQCSAEQVSSRQDNRRSSCLWQEGDDGWHRGPEDKTIAREMAKGKDNTDDVFIA